LWLLFAALLSAGGQLLSKMAVEDMEFWNLFVVRTLGLTVACAVLPFRPSVFAETRRMLSDRVGTGLLVGNEAAIAFGAVFLMLLAISLGPVSLVATVMSSRPLIVLIITVALNSRMPGMLDEDLDQKVLIQKTISAAMIVGGICTISIL
jgi:drug/metabolite transporter (DMT)-like permease